MSHNRLILFYLCRRKHGLQQSQAETANLSDQSSAASELERVPPTASSTPSIRLYAENVSGTTTVSIRLMVNWFKSSNGVLFYYFFFLVHSPTVVVPRRVVACMPEVFRNRRISNPVSPWPVAATATHPHGFTPVRVTNTDSIHRLPLNHLR